MDTIFGTLSTDALQLYRHRLLQRGLRHGYEIEPRQPRGHDPIRLTVTTGVDFSADSVVAYVTTDGSQPAGARGRAVQGDVFALAPVATRWDSLAGGYVQQWQGMLPGYAPGTLLRYRIGAYSAGAEETFADYPDISQSGEVAALRHFRHGLPPEMEKSYGDPQAGTTFTLQIAAPGAPAWAREAIIYHVFVDRFYPGDGRGWRQTDDLQSFCGGTLRGVREKLDYIADLGANCLWLSPIGPSPSHHGYDTTDYRDVEPRLGSKEDLRALVDAAHDRDMRVLLDMACNHVSDRHPLFRDARDAARSGYRTWFRFNESDLGYRGYMDVPTMPELNLDNPETRAWMIENALYWLQDFAIDGFRLDHADGPGPDFWTYFNRACKAEKADCFCFGEVIDAPDMLAAYRGRLDGLLDFQLCDALRQTFGWQTQTQADYERLVARHATYFPSSFVMPAFVDNHDMDRFTRIADGDTNALLAALEALLRLPNPPVIYYGTEIGLTQAAPPGQGLHTSRVPMRWGDAQDKGLLAKTRALLRARRDGRL